MTLACLCGALGFPEEASLRIRSTDTGLSEERTETAVRRLTDPADFEDEAAELKRLLVPDDCGFRMLKVMLQAALRSAVLYEERGISREIFVATMGCFPRFVREHLESFGAYGFDRWFWTGRQLSLRLFRIGTLEYELVEEDGVKKVSMHIPSDAELREPQIMRSVSEVREFLQKFEPEYAQAEFVCFSWLLSPALKQVLPETSNILRFQRMFRITGTDPEGDEYKTWVFKKPDLSPEDFPEETSLQRNLKRYVLAGGKVGHAGGIFLA